MPRQPKHTSITMCTLKISCPYHGQHRIVIAALDELAVDAAQLVKEHYQAGEYRCFLDIQRIPLDEARRAAGEYGLSLDDLPF